MKRRLTPDELRDVFTRCTARAATWQEVDLLKDHVEALGLEIVDLRAKARPAPAELDPQQRWMADHPDEVAKYEGKLVAVHATHGIIRASTDYDYLVSWLDAHKVPDGEVVIEFIRPRSVRKP